MQAYDCLARPIQKWIRNQGWQSLRDIQEQATHHILSTNDHLIIAASTAGGKTEAAFLPLISNVLDSDELGSSGFDLVYIGPLKALINDQTKRLRGICADTDLKITPWHGDVSASIKLRAEKHPSGILLITPESLEALFIRKGTRIPHLFGRTKSIVIDELHTFLDTERGIQLRSLMARLEIATSHKIRKIGLSATLGDINLAKNYLDPYEPEKVADIVAESGDAELQIQLRGYLQGGKGDDELSSGVPQHLFDKLRGTNNLIFAGSKRRVEEVADKLRMLCEDERLPLEFYPHHANLSKDHREFVEERLKSGAKPTTAICTSTLELGIDIGAVICVAQIGAPYTVASLRQRLGRSGRRVGQAAVLRQYEVENKLDQKSHFVDQLRLGTVRSIAMINLLLRGWCEAPRLQALHLSTLVHQILSIIAERGGASAKRLFITLCERGPFLSVNQALFANLLRHLGSPGIELIEQSEDNRLLLGKEGERLVEHYSFYAVFKTPVEYRILYDGKMLGTLPISQVIVPKMVLIFSGYRWEVMSVEQRDKTILVKPSPEGRPPRFRSAPGIIDDAVIGEMKRIYEGEEIPTYLDGTAVDLLHEARRHFQYLELSQKSIIELGRYTRLLAVWSGTIKNNTLALALAAKDFRVSPHDGFLEVDIRKANMPLVDALAEIQNCEEPVLFTENTDMVFDKFHPHLSKDLLEIDALSSRLDAYCLPDLIDQLLASLVSEY